jgi:hypothetical protein
MSRTPPMTRATPSAREIDGASREAEMVERRGGVVWPAVGRVRKAAAPGRGAGRMEAVGREKRIKAGSRANKIGLIEALNPHWRDLDEELNC